MAIAKRGNTNCLVGIEIEVEGIHEDADCICPPDGWVAEYDGSLREGGMEFKTDGGMEPRLVSQLLEDLYDFLDEMNAEHSVRCGMHVHVNMCGRSDESVLAFATAYSIMEPWLYSTLPEERDQGIYCVPWYRSDDTCADLMRAIQHEDPFIARGASKYTGLNIACLPDMGTVEFRMAPSFTNRSDAVDFVHNCLAIYNVALGLNASVVMEEVEFAPWILAETDRRDGWHCAEMIVDDASPLWEFDLDHVGASSAPTIPTY